MNAITELNDHTDRSLLIVEDDKPFLERLSRAMETRGFAVTSCDTVSDGLAQIGRSAPAFAVVDLRLGDGNGLDVVSALKRKRPEARAIVLTGYGNIATAVTAVKMGAVDYLSKPADADDVVAALVRATGRKLPRRAFRQNPLQGAAVHVEPPGGFGDVAVAHFVDALDVFPAHAVRRHRIFRRGSLGLGIRQQRGDDFIGIRRLGKIIERAELHGGDGGGDVAVAGQHDGAGVGALALQRRHHVEPVAVAQPQIHHGEGRRGCIDLRQPVGHGVAGCHREAAGFHRARQALQKWLVVLDDQQRAVGEIGQFGDGVQVRVPTGLRMQRMT